MTVRVQIVIEQGDGTRTEHVAAGPGTLVLPVLAKAAKSAVAAHEDEVRTIAAMIHAISDAWHTAL